MHSYGHCNVTHDIADALEGSRTSHSRGKAPWRQGMDRQNGVGELVLRQEANIANSSLVARRSAIRC